jgi:hypothetical protein
MRPVEMIIVSGGLQCATFSFLGAGPCLRNACECLRAVSDGEQRLEHVEHTMTPPAQPVELQ